MALDSTSTDQQILDAYRDNASYEETASTTKAKSFVTAILFILGDPVKAAEFGRSFERNPSELRAELNRARGYIARHSGRRVRYYGAGSR